MLGRTVESNVLAVESVCPHDVKGVRPYIPVRHKKRQSESLIRHTCFGPSSHRRDRAGIRLIRPPRDVGRPYRVETNEGRGERGVPKNCLTICVQQAIAPDQRVGPGPAWHLALSRRWQDKCAERERNESKQLGHVSVRAAGARGGARAKSPIRGGG